MVSNSHDVFLTARGKKSISTYAVIYTTWEKKGYADNNLGLKTF